MILLALNEQNMFIYPAQEEGLGYGVCDFLIPEVLHVLRFEVSEYLIAGVMLLKLLRDRGGCFIFRADPWQHYGQGMGRYLQELLHSPARFTHRPRRGLRPCPMLSGTHTGFYCAPYWISKTNTLHRISVYFQEPKRCAWRRRVHQHDTRERRKCHLFIRQTLATPRSVRCAHSPMPAVRWAILNQALHWWAKQLSWMSNGTVCTIRSQPASFHTSPATFCAFGRKQARQIPPPSRPLERSLHSSVMFVGHRAQEMTSFHLIHVFIWCTLRLPPSRSIHCLGRSHRPWAFRCHARSR